MPDRTMKAVQQHEFGGPEVLHIKEAPVPELKSGEVLVRVHAVGSIRLIGTFATATKCCRRSGSQSLSSRSFSERTFLESSKRLARTSRTSLQVTKSTPWSAFQAALLGRAVPLPNTLPCQPQRWQSSQRSWTIHMLPRCPCRS